MRSTTQIGCKFEAAAFFAGSILQYRYSRSDRRFPARPTERQGNIGTTYSVFDFFSTVEILEKERE